MALTKYENFILFWITLLYSFLASLLAKLKIFSEPFNPEFSQITLTGTEVIPIEVDLPDTLFELPFNLKLIRNSFLGKDLRVDRVIKKIGDKTFFISMRLFKAENGTLNLELTQGYQQDDGNLLSTTLNDETIILDEVNLMRNIKESMNLDFIDFYPYDNLIFERAEYFLKEFLAKFVTLTFNQEDPDLIALTKTPQLLANPIENFSLFGNQYKVYFYHERDDSFLLAFENQENSK